MLVVDDDSALNVKVMVRLLKSTLAKNPTVFSRSGHGNMWRWWISTTTWTQ